MDRLPALVAAHSISPPSPHLPAHPPRPTPADIGYNNLDGDIWTPAMDELAARAEDPLAAEEAGVRPLVAACALATSEDAVAELVKVRTLLGEHDEAGKGATNFPHLTHCFMNFAQKEAAKARFSFTQVAHCVVRTAAHEV